MRDVAEAAGVSTATVSKVLNGFDGQASAETRERVLRVVREIGYVPNSMARNLRRQESKVWSLLLPTIENPFVTQMARGIEDYAHETGYEVLIGNTDDDIHKERHYLEAAEQSRASGVLLAPTSEDVDVSRLLQLGIPVVSILRPLGDRFPVDTVLNATLETSRIATGVLLDSGCEHIGCLPGFRGDYTDEQRLLGYYQAHRERGLEPDPDLIVRSRTDPEGGNEAIRILLRQSRPNAILIAHSLMAIGVIGGLTELGIDPAKGPRLFSCDAANWNRALAPYLSYARQPAYEFGRIAAGMIIDRFGNRDLPPRTVVLPATMHFVGDLQARPVDGGPATAE